jgi:hypothetical protein
MASANGGRHALHLGTHSGWYRFVRQGNDWLQTRRALTYWNMTCLQVDPQDPRKVYLGTEHSGLFVTQDGGKIWKRADPNVPKLTLTSLLAIDGKLLAGTVPAALYVASDGGAWREQEGVRRGATGGTFPPSPDLGARTRYLAVEKRFGGRLYAGIEVGGMLVSDDGGDHWSAANTGLDDPDVHQVLPSVNTDGLVVAACGEGIFRSLDRSAHWENVTPPGTRTYGTAVAEDNNGTLYLSVARGRPNTWLRDERADSALFTSRDGGAHWELVCDGLRGGVMDLSAGLDGEGVLAATSEGEVLGIDSSGCRTLIEGLPCINALDLGA